MDCVFPTDIAIVGFDNQELIATQLDPPLTTVALPHYELGRWAVQYLLSSGDVPRPPIAAADRLPAHRAQFGLEHGPEVITAEAQRTQRSL